MLAIQIARELQGRNALRGVRKDADRGQQINERHLARSENGSARNRKLMMAGRALELAAGLDRIDVQTAATRADRLTVGFRPAQFAEFEISRLFAVLEDGLETEGSSCR